MKTKFAVFALQKKFLAKEEEEVLKKNCACVYANSAKEKKRFLCD